MPNTSCHLTRHAETMGPSYQVIHVTNSPQILILPASAWLKKCTYNSTLSCLLMIKHIYIHLKFNHLSIYNSCFIIHIQTQLILVSSGATCYSIGNLFIDLGPTFLLSVQPQYFRVDDDHEYDNGKKINLLIMFTCQRQINLSKKIKAVSQYFDVDQDTERKLKRCERSPAKTKTQI